MTSGLHNISDMFITKGPKLQIAEHLTTMWSPIHHIHFTVYLFILSQNYDIQTIPAYKHFTQLLIILFRFIAPQPADKERSHARALPKPSVILNTDSLTRKEQHEMPIHFHRDAM